MRRLLLTCLLLVPGVAGAQLRPLDPLDWDALEAPGNFVGELGAGFYSRQRLSLSGTEGDLVELGNVRLSWRTGRTVLEASWTAWRMLEDDLVFAAAAHEMNDAFGTRRDVGDARISTIVGLTAPDRPVAFALRFGTRLPTTDDGVGLERDRTDFFALGGARVRRGRMRASAELGLGIHGTVHDRLEQADVLLFGLRTEYEGGRVAPSLTFVGQKDGFDGFNVRGNEELAELRVGLRTAGSRWVRVEWVHGHAQFSPAAGWLLSAGIRR